MAITLDGSAGITTPGVTDTGNLSVTGTATAASLIPSGSSVPANGMYLSAANTLNFATNSTNRMNIDSSGNLQVGGTTVGNTAGYVNSRTNARAWVQWAGSTGTIASSYNVSSVTRSSTGNFIINFATALADNKYTVAGSCGSGGTTGGYMISNYVSAPTTTACYVSTFSTIPALTDYTYTSAIIFGN